MSVLLPFGGDFRQTSGFGGGGDSGGNIFQNETSAFDGDKGWLTPPTDSRDRVSGNDVRIRGICYDTGPTQRDYKIILPSASPIDITLALGDPGAYAHSGQKVEFFDNTTSLFVVTKAGSLAGDHYLDATGVERTSASDWVTNNAVRTNVSMSTTTLIMRLGDGVNLSTISHLHIAASAASSFIPYNPWYQTGPILAQ